MRKYQWFVIVILIGCIVSFAGCQRIKRVVAPETVETMPPEVEPEMPEEPVVEVPPEVEPEMPEEPVVEAPPETEPEMPEEPVVVEDDIEGTIVGIDPAQITSPAVGGQLQVNIQIAQASDVTGYDVKLTFDPEALKYVASSNADYLPPGAFEVPAVVSENSVYVAAASLSDAASASSGTLATVTFEVLAVKASTLTLSEVILTDSNAQESQPSTIAAGEISVP